jgi:hypothetical protein
VFCNPRHLHFVSSFHWQFFLQLRQTNRYRQGRNHCLSCSTPVHASAASSRSLSHCCRLARSCYAVRFCGHQVAAAVGQGSNTGQQTGAHYPSKGVEWSSLAWQVWMPAVHVHVVGSAGTGPRPSYCCGATLASDCCTSPRACAAGKPGYIIHCHKKVLIIMLNAQCNLDQCACT